MKKLLFTLGLLLSGVVCFGQETFIQNYIDGLKVGDIQITLTDSTITIDERTTNITLTNSSSIDGLTLRTFSAPNGVDEFGYETKNLVQVMYNPSAKGNARYSVTYITLNTFDKSRTKYTSLYID